MAAGDTLQGRRVQRDAPSDVMFEGAPGAYALSADRTAFYALLPNGQGIRLDVREGADPGTVNGQATWGFTEHENGTLTIAPSIWLHAGPGWDGWHGFLEHGVWREV